MARPKPKLTYRQWLMKLSNNQLLRIIKKAGLPVR